MYITPNRKRLSELNLNNVQIGDNILFCPECDFQIENACIKPICPNCNYKHLHITKVDNELFNINILDGIIIKT